MGGVGAFRERGGGHIGWDGLMDRVQIRRICLSDRARRRGPALFRIGATRVQSSWRRGPRRTAIGIETAVRKHVSRRRWSGLQIVLARLPPFPAAKSVAPRFCRPRPTPNANPPPPRFPLRCLVCARGNASVKASFNHYWIAITSPHPPPPPCHAAANDRPCFLEQPWRRHLHHHPPPPPLLIRS